MQDSQTISVFPNRLPMKPDPDIGPKLSLIFAGIASVAILAFSSSADAKDSKGDTLTMSCAHARQLVGGRGGTLLYSGPDRYDLYHRGGASCLRLQQTTQAAYVPTKDNPTCFIGYTCVEIDNMPRR